LISKASNLVFSLGINDINNNRTLAQLQADLLTLWTMQASQGKRVFQLTITPITTSTDYFQTLANQTPTNAQTVRVGFNDWLRDGAPIVSGVAVAVGTSGAVRAKYLTGDTVTSASSGNHPLYGAVEFADTVESSRNSGKWKAPSYSRSVNDVVCVSGNYYFTSASFAGTSADLGRRVIIAGAGAAGANLLTAILSLSSATNPLIIDAIGTSLNPATGIVYEPMTTDGIHPDAVAHELLKSAIPSAHFL
jgi:lysophospholipase L1-like esterase